MTEDKQLLKMWLCWYFSVHSGDVQLEQTNSPGTAATAKCFSSKQAENL